MGSVGRGKNCIVSKIFIDTNILVYSIDNRDSEKNRELEKFSPKQSTHTFQ